MRQLPFGDVLGDRRLVEAFPTLDAVGAAGVDQAFAASWALGFVVIERLQDVAGREIGGVQVEDVLGEPPAELQKTSHLRPRRIGDDHRVGADVEGRLRAEIAPPPADGAHVPEMFVQHVGDHAQDAGKAAGRDLIFEIEDDDRPKYLAHESFCLQADQAPPSRTSRSRIIRPSKVLATISSRLSVGQFGSGNGSPSPLSSDSVGLM